jgi:hypothetical protein
VGNKKGNERNPENTVLATASVRLTEMLVLELSQPEGAKVVVAHEDVGLNTT